MEMALDMFKAQKAMMQQEGGSDDLDGGADVDDLDDLDDEWTRVKEKMKSVKSSVLLQQQ